MMDTQVQPWNQIGALSELPSPHNIQEGYRFFARDTKEGFVLSIDPYTKRRTWIEICCAQALPPVLTIGDLPAAGPDNVGLTIFVNGVGTYLSVETSPGVFNWLLILPAVPPPGGVLSFAEFYIIVPTDTNSAVAQNAPVLFYHAGPTSGGGIVPNIPLATGCDQFVLPAVGIYRVDFTGTYASACQLKVYLNGAPVPSTGVGHATGTVQTVINRLVTAAAGDLLSIVNDDSGAGITLSTTPGGSQPAVADLIITRLS